MEDKSGDRIILEEKVVPEEDRVLTSKRYKTTDAGGVLREIRLAFCDFCRRRLSDNDSTILCSSCQRKLCSSCAIFFEGQHYCHDDLQDLLPLDRLGFKIIHGLVNGLDTNEIRDLTGCKRDAFKSALNQLAVNGHVEKIGVSLFSHCRVLDHGILAWKTYDKAFSKDEDVRYFIEEVKRRLEEVREDGVERQDRKRR